jgi:uncharacterized membrane protein
VIRTKKKFGKFRMDSPDHIAQYNALLDNPLVDVTERETEIEKLNEYNDRGQLSRSVERLYFLVHWTEKII